MARTIAEVSESTLKLQACIESKPPGARLSYVSIEHETGVKMDVEGKAFLRTALKRANREYACERGYGITLADQGNAMHIVGGRVSRIGGAARRAQRTAKNIESQFLDKLPAADQQRLVFVNSMFAAINSAQKSLRSVYEERSKGSQLRLEVKVK